MLFEDDAPLAIEDEDDIIEGPSEDLITTSGNVIVATDPDTADPDFQGGQQADDFGDDGPGTPQVVEVNGNSGNVTASGGIGGAGAAQVLGTYGYLELDENGNYTYYLTGESEVNGVDHDTDNDGDPDPVTDEFTYTIQDDGTTNGTADPQSATGTGTSNWERRQLLSRRR